ncbi:hypothetical protein JAAARDRAFT_37689 [Jaapia argillacea MUCL 33604]|uniref:Phospholipid:diacylglycerol acyltransferase n=1 Tax=Jaapia argillacea MUCL 33604 TaxID=933084 RepID=A0A067PJT3_9AGAM|nr:hypothetical protein JAAARDRAFT_37689 [Jaapia argillacea MUCL 33604]
MAIFKRTKTWADADSAKAVLTNDQEDETELHRIADELKEEAKLLKEKTKEAAKKEARHFYTMRRFLFPLGILVGVFIGFVLIQPVDMPDIPAHFALLMNDFDLSLPEFTLFDIESEWNRFRSNIPEIWKLNNDGREFQVGDQIKARGLEAKYPVVLIPGVISTSLESWSTSPQYRSFFRQKMWGGYSMIQQVTFNRERWMNTLMLDPISGLDPPGAKVRAAEGIDAASSFVQGYWIWSKIVENLAVVNYDTNNLYLAPYDWRLSYYNLEERDGYFTRLKTIIESLNFKWVESPLHGKGGPDWVEAKAMSAFLSGEMKDTVQMNPAGAYVLERFFSKQERAKLFRSWAGTASMWIKGGNAVWGNDTFAPDDEANQTHTHGELIAFRQPLDVSAQNDDENDVGVGNMTAENAGIWILEHTPVNFQRMMESNYSNGIERDEKVLKRNNLDHRKWTNPLEVQLPNAPSMKMYCVYGHGKETERYSRGEYEFDETMADGPNAVCYNTTNCETPRPPLDMPMLRRSWIDSDYTNESVSPKIRNGVKLGEGDGTVSLLSLGAMCVEGWKRPRWNPAGIKVVTVELPHRPALNMPRGGANTSDHVDILGSTGVNEIILKVATGVGHEVEENFVSDIRKYANRVRWD